MVAAGGGRCCCWSGVAVAVAAAAAVRTFYPAGGPEGLNAGIVRAVELDRDQQPLRLTTGVGGWPSAADAAAVAATVAAHALLSAAAALSGTALGDATRLPHAARFDFDGVDAFLRDCVAPRRPCVLRGAPGHEASWAPSVLSTALGAGGTVRPLLNREHRRTFSQHANENGLMTAHEFAQAVQQHDVQLRISLADWEERNATALVAPPAPLGRGDCCLAHAGVWFESGGSGEATWARSKPSGFWFASARSRTPLHNDATDSLLLQLSGAKRVLMAPPSASLLAVQMIGAAPGHQLLDLVQGSSWQKALLAQLMGASVAELERGDTLYVPALFLHDVEVEAAEVSVSFACRFRPRCLRRVPKGKHRRGTGAV